MAQPNPNYQDGLNAVTLLSVFCYNNSATYTTYDGNPAENATVKEFTDSDMQPLGSNTQTGFRKGTLNLQYTLATDEAPGATNLMRPGYIVSFRGRYYAVGQVSPAVKKNDVIKFSVNVTELQNPFIGNLLTSLGQQKTASINANIATTVNCAALNNRTTGSNVTYSVETFSTPGAAAPAGVTIAANGLLTVNVAVGAYDIRVIATDTVTGQNTNYGWGRYTPTAA